VPGERGPKGDQGDPGPKGDQGESGQDAELPPVGDLGDVLTNVDGQWVAAPPIGGSGLDATGVPAGRVPTADGDDSWSWLPVEAATDDAWGTEVLADDPLVFWRDATGTDASGWGRHLTRQGKHNLTASPLTRRLLSTFHATATSGAPAGMQFLQAGDDEWMDQPQSVTVELVAHYVNQGGGQLFVSRDAQTLRSFQLGIDSGTGRLQLIYGTTGVPLESGPWLSTPVALADGPHHVAFTHDHVAGVTRLYVDGVEAASLAKPGAMLQGAARITVGVGDGGGSGQTVYNPANCPLEGIAIYAAALPAARIRAHAQAAGVIGGSASYVTRAGTDVIAPGEVHQLLVPVTPKSLPGVMYVHGASGDETYPTTPSAMITPLSEALAKAGHTGLSARWGGPQTWGNPTSVARLSDGYAYLQGLPDVAPGKVVLVAGSAGALAALNWAAANPGKVACMVLHLPVVDPDDVVTNNRGGYASLVNGAYPGGWSQATYGATSNPVTMAAAGLLDGVAILLHVGAADAVAPPATVAALAAGADAAVVHTVPGGHEQATYSRIDPQMSAAFIAEHAN
jgi:dienelactone hydrolase